MDNPEGGSHEPVEPLRMAEHLVVAVDAEHLVFVVDADWAVRDSLKFALESEGLAAHACRDGPALLEHPELPRAHCIVLVDDMPEMDGFAILAQLQARGRAAPVVLIAGHATDALRRRAAAAGVRHVVEKPLLDNALVESIHDILGRPAT